MENPITARIGLKKYKTTLQNGTHHLVADEPHELGGEDQGPMAGTLLKMALGACTAITLRMYADRKGWDLQEVIAKVDYEKTGEGTIFHRQLEFTGQLDEKQRKRLMQIANACPVHRVLSGPIDIETEIVDAS
ncbi:MAG: OsmC family protein [Saprospiraceae bacterium]